MDFDVEYDVVVVGGGGSGKSAAYTVASESDLSVVLLEKMKETGGTSAYAEGQCASESSEVKARERPDYPGKLPEDAHFPTCEEHIRNYITYSHRRANLDVVKAFVYNSAETIDILKSIGVVYTHVTNYAFEQPDELYTFHRPDGLGARVQELLLRACENSGVDIFVNTPVKELIFDDGRVAGVKARDEDGNEIRIGAKAVILATGGMANNPELIEEYSWMPQLRYTNKAGVPTQNTGDGLKMALSAGADTDALGTLMVTCCPPGKTAGSHIHGGAIQPTLWVDSKGRRYVNEQVAHSFSDMGNTIGMLPDGTSFSLFDADLVRHYMEVGSDIAQGDFCPYGAKLDRFADEIAQSIEDGDGAAYRADSLEELAGAIGVGAQVLRETVDAYNDACDKGVDDDMGKDPRYLRPIRKAPFVAIKVIPDVLVSCGGIRVNGDMQVTDKNYDPIPGLYAVGMEASGLYGDTYNLDCPGTANGFAHTSGRLAARHAVKRILEAGVA